MKKRYVAIITIVLFLFSTSAKPMIGTNNNTALLTSTTSDRYHYFTYDEMTEFLQSLAANHSDIMYLESIGETFEGRQIWLVKLSDDVQVEETNEPGVLFIGAHHGNEKPSFEVVIRFIEHMINKYGLDDMDDDGDTLINEDIIDGVDNDNDGLVDEDPSESRVTMIIDSMEIYCVPMVNPDGVEAVTRTNQAPNYGSDGKSDTITSYGVDLNRNYGFLWNLPHLNPVGYMYPFLSDDQYGNFRGEFPFCENETQAIKGLVERVGQISISLSYHDYGEFMIFPWTHTTMHTPDEALFRSIGHNMSRINGYELRGEREYLIPWCTGTVGCSENWLYGVHGILAFTIELCSRRTEYNVSRVHETCLDHIGVNMYVCERAQTIDLERQGGNNPPSKFWVGIDSVLNKLYDV
jgi:carboxypeptidase T